MQKSLLAGVLMFAAISLLPTEQIGMGIAPATAQETGSISAAPEGVVVSDAAIAKLKRALRLSPAQEVHWRAVEAKLRNITQNQNREQGQGFIQRVRAKIGSFVVSAAAAKEVAAAARPLIASLDEQQKQDGRDVIRELGVSSLF